MTKSMLITRPEHDDTTHYLSNWGKSAIDLAELKGIKVFDLHRTRANKREVVSVLVKCNPHLVILNGHGDHDVVSGHNREPLIVAGQNEQLLKNKITYAVSCQSARTLGPKSVDAGANAYIGYRDDFIFFYDPLHITRPANDQTAKLFLQPSTELITSLVKGNTVDESSKRSQQLFAEHIKKLLTSEASPAETSMARYLWWDMVQQTCLGDLTAALQ